jgi:hypothetical protein
MYEQFAASFLPDAPTSEEGRATSDDQYVFEVVQHFGGQSFNGGLYRVLSASDVRSWNHAMEAAFPEFNRSVHCFAFDWLGRVFAVDGRRQVRKGFGVVMFEPGSGQALQIPCDLRSFHDEELCEYADAALAEDLYRRWLETGGMRPSFRQCIGYKRPLFLGGSDTVDNLELVDLDVYWTISAQLISKLRGVSIGSGVNIFGGTEH